MRALAAVLAIASLAACAPASAADPSPAGEPVSAQVAQGPLTGRKVGEIVSFKGIPYAAPPVGPLRWRPPAAPAAWTAPRDASAFGADCMQGRPFWDQTQSKQPVSEDCLTLNVWTPAVTKGAPVLVWIHGGGFVMGSGSQPIFDGAALAARGAVVVTFNYRLGRFGFFAHPALTAEAAGGPTGNWAYMDQIAALQWVKANIAAFGGDPGNVTIFGESAGGGSVQQLMLMAPARGLFHKAIVQSGGGYDVFPTLTQGGGDKIAGEAAGLAFAASAGVKDGDVAALRAIPADKVKGSLDLINQQKDTYSGPMIDGVLVTGGTYAGLAAGRAAAVPVMVGANSDELGGLPGFIKGPMANKAAMELGDALPAIQAGYGSKEALEGFLLNDLTFVGPARSAAGAIASHGQPAWLYSFAYVAEAKRKPGEGAGHASDQPFTFGNLRAALEKVSPADEAASKVMGDYIVAFARTGDPNGAGRPAWPRYERKADRLLVLGNDGPVVQSAPRAAALDALEATKSP